MSNKYGRITDSMIAVRIEFYCELYKRVSGKDLTLRYEESFGQWHNLKHGVSYNDLCSGTRHDIYAWLVAGIYTMQMMLGERN